MDLILASTSRYRRQLLERLQLPFDCVAPAVEETPLPGEAPEALAGRLSLAKAAAVAAARPGALVIGSDQVACIDGQVTGKPGNHASATAQLQASSGKRVTFLTGVAVTCPLQGIELLEVVPFAVQFRQLRAEEIENYLQREQPYDCAGSFKCEGLGIALFEAMEGPDPTALEGLPLIALTRLLAEAGMPVLAS